jgi:hypothetical protein
MARLAASNCVQTTTPLPRASPSAFTAQRPLGEPAKMYGAFGSLNVSDLGTGMLCLRMNCCAKDLDDSSRAADRSRSENPQTPVRKTSTISAPKGSSGPTTVKSARKGLAASASVRRSVACMSSRSTGAAVGRQELTSDPRIAGSTPQPLNKRRTGQLPNQRVLTTAATNHEDSHSPVLSRRPPRHRPGHRRTLCPGRPG